MEPVIFKYLTVQRLKTNFFLLLTSLFLLKILPILLIFNVSRPQRYSLAGKMQGKHGSAPY